jgi:hypothetical protein
MTTCGHQHHDRADEPGLGVGDVALMRQDREGDDFL